MPMDNADMRIAFPSADFPAPELCPICEQKTPVGRYILVVPVTETRPDDEPIGMCQTCGVRALRRVWEYCGGRGVHAIPAWYLSGPHPATGS